MAGDGEPIELPKTGYLVLSEPLDEVVDHWQEVPESSRLLIRNKKATIAPLFG